MVRSRIDLRPSSVYLLFMKNFFTNVCLLVSADRDEWEVFGKALKDASPETVYCQARNGKEALAMITDGHLIPDLIFTELDMPNMDGVEFLKQLKGVRLNKNVAVVVHTKLSNRYRYREILDAGAFAVYSKEYEYNGIFNVLSLYCLPELIPCHLN